MQTRRLGQKCLQRPFRLCVVMQGNRTAERRFKNLDMQPLSRIMASLGHTWIDVLKVCSRGMNLWGAGLLCMLNRAHLLSRLNRHIADILLLSMLTKGCLCDLEG